MIEVLFATLVIGISIAAYDRTVALLYVLVASRSLTLADWLTLTLAMFVWGLYKAVVDAVKRQSA